MRVGHGRLQLPDGRRGFFHPDNFTFGQSVFLSRVVAAAMDVPGVEWVDVDDTPPKPNRFRRWGEESHGEIAAGRIDLGRLEIARLDNEPVVVLESEKASMELPAPESGTITEVLKKTGDTVAVGEVIAYLEPGQAKTDTPPVAAQPKEEPRVMPGAARELAQRGLSPKEVKPTGPGGRILKEDVLRHVKDAGEAPPPERWAEVAREKPEAALREEETVPISPIRRRIAERLVQAQQTAALLTTFNEIDMSAVKALRQKHRDAFEKKYNVKLGFMSFFVKASIEALRRFPAVNASIDGNDIVYHEFYDVGVAVSTDRGLMVPVLRNAEMMSFAEIEVAVGAYAQKARDGSITIEELTGGTFSITNGGVFGSMMSTPILNPPQSAILGMHAIFERPMAEKLAYLRTALKALGNGLLVQDRRSGPSRTAPAAVSSRGLSDPPNRPIVNMLSKAGFDRLPIEDKLAYLSRTMRQLKSLRGRVRGGTSKNPLGQSAHGAAANPVKLRG